MDRTFRLGRRALLRGAGVALALPFLDITRPAVAATGPGIGNDGRPQRFIVVYSSNGYIPSTWTSGTGTSFTVGASLTGLAAHRSDLLFVNGVDNLAGENSFTGPHDNAGMTALTGADMVVNGTVPDPETSRRWDHGGISIDQEIAKHIGGDTRLRSLNLCVGDEAPGIRNVLSATGPKQPLSNESDPRGVYDRIFGGFDFTGGAVSGDSAALERLRAERRSVLDLVKEDYADLTARLGAEDRRRLEYHVETIRALEATLDKSGSSTGTATGACRDPATPATSSGTRDFPAEVRAFIDLQVMALACDQTRVVTNIWPGTESYWTYTWLGHTEDHHALSHKGDANSTAQRQLTEIDNWYSEQIGYLVERLKAVPEGDGTLFDSTSILWVHELAKGSTHSLRKIPYVLVGSAGGKLGTGRVLEYTGRTSNDLFVALLRAYGIDAASFGAAEYNTGALTDILA